MPPPQDALGGRRFGKARQAASPNFGEGFSLALSRTAGAPRRFRAEDFSHHRVLRYAPA
jgi:uncharacterized protein with PIN domain